MVARLSPFRSRRAGVPPVRAILVPLLVSLGVCLTGCAEPRAVVWTDRDAQTVDAPAILRGVPVALPDSALRIGAAAVASREADDVAREEAMQALLRAQIPSAVRVPAPLAPVSPLPASPSTLGDGAVPQDALRCVGTMRLADSPGRGRVAVWWTRRPAGRVALLAAWRDGAPAAGGWRGPIPVDTLDVGPQDARAAERGLAGCARPAPSVVVDDLQGFVHVGYAVAGPEGAGVFYAHQMDPRAGFEVPIAIVYGERPGVVRVAAAGSTVALTYEEPNSPADRPRVALALSRTAGHTFEERLVASASSVASRDPAVLVQDGQVVVGWLEQAAPGTTPLVRVRRARVQP